MTAEYELVCQSDPVHLAFRFSFNCTFDHLNHLLLWLVLWQVNHVTLLPKRFSVWYKLRFRWPNVWESEIKTPKMQHFYWKYKPWHFSSDLHDGPSSDQYLSLFSSVYFWSAPFTKCLFGLVVLLRKPIEPIHQPSPLLLFQVIKGQMWNIMGFPGWSFFGLRFTMWPQCSPFFHPLIYFLFLHHFLSLRSEKALRIELKSHEEIL